MSNNTHGLTITKFNNILHIEEFILNNGYYPRNKKNKRNNNFKLHTPSIVTDDERKLGQFWVNWGQEVKNNKKSINNKQRLNQWEVTKYDELFKLGCDIRSYTRKIRLFEINEFINKTGKKPDAESIDKIESSLGKWLFNLSISAKKGTATNEEIESINAIKFRFKSIHHKMTQLEKLEEIYKFCIKNNRTPTRGSSNKHESTLSGRLNSANIKMNALNILTTEEFVLLFNINKYKSFQSTWDRVFNLLDFCKTNGRLPRDGYKIVNKKQVLDSIESDRYKSLTILNNKLHEKNLIENQIILLKEINSYN